MVLASDRRSRASLPPENETSEFPAVQRTEATSTAVARFDPGVADYKWRPSTSRGHTGGVGSPDYGAALDSILDASAVDVAELLAAAAAPMSGSDVTLYLADFQSSVLQPLLLSRNPATSIVAEEDVASSMAGRVFRTGEPLVVERESQTRVWVPLVERAERTGVVALTVPEVDQSVLAECVRLGRFAGLLVRSFARTTDLMHLRRRGRSMSLAAGMQWDVLPPLTVRCAEALACGRLEPAYEIAGDAFDYVVNDRHLHAAIFDGMGHGVESTMMTTLAIGAYRHARRAGDEPESMYAVIDKVLGDQYAGEAFVTGALARIDVETGELVWTNAGHPAPFLLRNRKVVSTLRCSPSLPFGLGGPCQEVAREALEPGDCVLFHTDGVTEGRSNTGEEFGLERLVRLLEQHAASALGPDETLRLLVEDIIAYNAGRLRDDASLILVCWQGKHPGPGPR
jgi:hypothetical protein